MGVGRLSSWYTQLFGVYKKTTWNTKIHFWGDPEKRHPHILSASPPLEVPSFLDDILFGLA